MTAHKAKKPTTKPAKANGNTTAPATTARAKGQRKPSVPYSDELGSIICERLREGETLLSICSSSNDLPSESAVRQWAAELAHPFAANYARAREVGYVKMADEVIALSDGLEAGDSRFEPGVVQRHRLMVDSRKWILGKCLPKIYGDRVQAEVSGPDGGPLQIEAAAAIKALIEAMPELGMLSLNGPALTIASNTEPEAKPALADGEGQP